jgi:hypothetical protein
MTSPELGALGLIKQGFLEIAQSHLKNLKSLEVSKTSWFLIEASFLKPFEPRVSKFFGPFLILADKGAASFAGSRRVLATAVDDWSENLFALAPVRAYAYVQ